MTRWHWQFLQFSRLLWVRATLLGILGVAAAVFAAVVEPYIPFDLPTHFGADAVESLLTIMASSMLAVTTFSLGVITSAYGSASSGATPRATRLLMEDQLTNHLLSTFIGSFLFSMVGIVVLKTGAYGERGRFILFVVTVLVIVLVVVTLLRWINHLTRLGRLGETTNRVETAARRAIEQRVAKPYLGGRGWDRQAEGQPAGATRVLPPSMGYVEHVDMMALEACAEHFGVDLYLSAIPGTLLYLDTPLVWVVDRPASAGSESGVGARETSAGDAALQDAVREAFSIGPARAFEQDPRFGLAVMSEVGSRALSSAINDPGTALDVVNRMTRLVALWAEHPGSKREAPRDNAPTIEYEHVFVPALTPEDIFDDAFLLLCRDAAGLIEIQLRLQKSLFALARIGGEPFRRAALKQAAEARERAESALTLATDRKRLAATVEQLEHQDRENRESR